MPPIMGRIRSIYSLRADTYAVGRIVRYSVVPEKQFYEVRALACNSTSGRSYEARIHLPRTSVNKGKKTAHIGRQWLTERRIGLLISSKVEQKGASRKLGKDGWGSRRSPNHLAKPSHNHFYRSYFYGCIYSASTTWTQPFTKLVL